MGVRAIVFLIGLVFATTTAWAQQTAPKITTWTGTAGDWNLMNADNWDIGAPSRNFADTVVFGSGVTGGTISWPSGGSNQPKNASFSFTAGAPSFTFSGGSAIDNAAGGITYTTASGVTTLQTFGEVRTANFTVTLNGSGNMTFTTVTGANTFSETSVNTVTTAVNDSAATLTFNNFTQQRAHTITKSGSGTLKLSGNFEIVYGFRDDNGGQLITNLKTSGGSAGVIDLSAATAVFESQLDVNEALVDGVKYTIVDYANATLIGDALTGFGTVTGVLPENWGLRNNTADKKIYLQQIPEPVLALPLTGAVALLRRRGRIAR